MQNRNILISGASIAGPALAYWLHRRGFHPTVVERAPALRDGGYAVDLRGAALRVVERMGILADVRRQSTQMGDVWYVDGANRRLATLGAEVMSGEVEILRGDLARILHAATRDQTEYLFDDSVTALSQGDDGIRVRFERREPRAFDLVVGADGLHSNVRALAFGEESRWIRHLGYYISIFTTANHLDLDHTGRYYNSPGRLAGLYSARQNSEAKALFCFASPPLHHDPRDAAQQKKLLAEAFAGEGWEVPRLLRALHGAPDFYFDSVSQIHLDGWSSGRTVLLGDAGYCASPLSGQGTGMALVGAYVLAGELQAAGGDHRTAFARYEEQMRAYVDGCQRLAQGSGRGFVPATRWQIWLRNQSLRMLPYTPWKGLLAAGPRRAANAIALRDYPD
jgi:2-polyprenyl-6-methoxyphenol hydroxylase-like FAD-dependent oxidoreductase